MDKFYRFVKTMPPKYENLLLWPPTPNPESWGCDTPNEGLWFNLEDGLVDTFADYNGLYVFDSSKYLMFVRIHIAPTKNQEYLAAYKVILEEFECCWHNPLPPEATWPQIAGKVIARLKDMGWREVIQTELNSSEQWTYLEQSDGKVMTKLQVFHSIFSHLWK